MGQLARHALTTILSATTLTPISAAPILLASTRMITVLLVPQQHACSKLKTIHILLVEQLNAPLSVLTTFCVSKTLIVQRWDLNYVAARC